MKEFLYYGGPFYVPDVYKLTNEDKLIGITAILKTLSDRYLEK